MKIENFISGKYIAHNQKTEYVYKSFLPNSINHDWTWENSEINKMLSKANRLLGEFNAYSSLIPSINLFIEMHIVKEASASSKIEGTQTNIDEAIMDKDKIDPEKRDDWQEVRNYIKSLHRSIERLEKLPLSSRLLREAHKILMRGVRGDKKTPGEFRKSQNWIGGANLQTALFIPPAHNEIAGLISDLEKFWHNNTISVPHLIRIAISHYQFETIHPFLDGNGRTGRLLIILYLVSKGLLNKPSLYLSDYFEKNRQSYYDALNNVRVNNDMIHWIKFFLNGVIETSQKGKKRFEDIINLKHKVENKILSLGKRTELAQNFLNFLYQKPIVNVKNVIKELNIAQNTANTLVKAFCKLGILKEISKFKRNRLFKFVEYINLFENGK